MKSTLVALAILFLFVMPSGVVSGQETTAKDLAVRVDKARVTFEEFQQDPRMTWFRNNVRYAKGLLIMTNFVKGGFIFGGSVGKGVLLAQDKDGQWSHPAFYDVVAGSVGLQAGVKSGEVILMIMTDTGLRRFLRDKFQLGADASIGVGPDGVGAKAEIFDIFSFARVKGLFAGFSVEGGGVVVNRDDNRTYYGTGDITPRDILLRRNVGKKQAEPLIQALIKASGSGAAAETKLGQ